MRGWKGFRDGLGALEKQNDICIPSGSQTIHIYLGLQPLRSLFRGMADPALLVLKFKYFLIKIPITVAIRFKACKVWDS
jgi:hypothetical protein